MKKTNKISFTVSISIIEAEWRIYASVNLAIIGLDNGLSPDWHQAIIWTNTGINYSEILIDVHKFSFKKMYLKISSGKWRAFCLSLNALKI